MTSPWQPRDRDSLPSLEAPVRDLLVSYTTIHSSHFPPGIIRTQACPVSQALDLDRRQKGLAPAAGKESDTGLEKMCQSSRLSFTSLVHRVPKPILLRAIAFPDCIISPQISFHLFLSFLIHLPQSAPTRGVSRQGCVMRIHLQRRKKQRRRRSCSRGSTAR